MKKIGYLGFNENMILKLIENENYNLHFVITQQNRLSNTMIKLLKVMKIPCYIVNNKNDLMQYENMYEKVDYILAYCFGIIIPDSIVNKYKCFNIHPGDLRTNRGAYPLVRNILNKDKEATLTLHRIGKEIDTGVVIGEYRVPITDEDDNLTLMDKLNEGISYLLDKLQKYDENKEYLVIEKGKYFKKVGKEDISIKEEDKYEDIDRKIRAQKSYGGALAEYKGYIVRISEIIKSE